MWEIAREKPEHRKGSFRALYRHALEPRLPNASQDRRLKQALARPENFYDDQGPDDVEVASNLVWHLEQYAERLRERLPEPSAPDEP